MRGRVLSRSRVWIARVGRRAVWSSDREARRTGQPVGKAGGRGAGGAAEGRRRAFFLRKRLTQKNVFSIADGSIRLLGRAEGREGCVCMLCVLAWCVCVCVRACFFLGGGGGGGAVPWKKRGGGWGEGGGGGQKGDGGGGVRVVLLGGARGERKRGRRGREGEREREREREKGARSGARALAPAAAKTPPSSQKPPPPPPVPRPQLLLHSDPHDGTPIRPVLNRLSARL
jgi:hypothetical protein